VLGTLSLWRQLTALRLDQAALQRLQAEARLAQLAAQQASQAPATCDASRLRAFLEAFRAPPLDAPEEADTAAACLERLSDPASVAPLFDVVRQARASPSEGVAGPLPTFESGRVARTLARMNDAVVVEIAGALDDPDADVRRTASLALVRKASPRSLAALSRAVYDPEPGTREAVASVFRELVASQGLPVQRSFELLCHLARDENPGTRRSAAYALALFRGREARRLGDRLARDRDPDVRAAAESTLRAFHGF
jgi:hypothetical protein